MMVSWKGLVVAAQMATLSWVAVAGESAARAQSSQEPPPLPAGVPAPTAPPGQAISAPVPPAYYGGPPPGAYPPPPGAYVPPLPPGYHRHDGAYVRLQLGGGYTSFKSSSNGFDIALSGGSIHLDVAVGGAVVDNLIVFGDIFFADADRPDVKINGSSAGAANGSVDVVGIGGGVAYYFPDINLYLSGTLAATKMEVNDSDSNTVGSTRLGFGFSGLIGKEWWVSADWGLGAAAQFIVASMKDGGDITPDSSWTALSFGLLFSATYN